MTKNQKNILSTYVQLYIQQHFLSHLGVPQNFLDTRKEVKPHIWVNKVFLHWKIFITPAITFYFSLLLLLQFDDTLLFIPLAIINIILNHVNIILTQRQFIFLGNYVKFVTKRITLKRINYFAKQKKNSITISRDSNCVTKILFHFGICRDFLSTTNINFSIRVFAFSSSEEKFLL